MQRTYSIVNIGNSNFSQQFLCCLEELSHERKWHGRRLPIKYQLSESKEQIEITTKLLANESVEGMFINHSINVSESNIQYENVLSDEFNKLVLLCGLKDLLEKPIVRNVINGYRMMMNYQGRSNDVYLCLIDDDSVLTYLYEDDEVQLQLDFFQLLDEKKHSNVILSSKYKALLNELELQEFGQYVIPIPRHHSEVVKICKNLFVHLPKNKFSGYIEVAQVILNDLLEPIGYKITKFSRNQKYNYMFNIMSLFKKLFSTKLAQANIAVVGTAAAGKTLLINDMMIAMHRMGYVPVGPQKYTDIRNLRFDIRNKETDPIYAMRNKYIYDAIYSFGDSKNIDITFVNIPGEVFKEDRLWKCSEVFEAIKKITAKVFIKRTIKLTSGEEVNFLEYKALSKDDLLTKGSVGIRKQEKKSYLYSNENYFNKSIFKENFDTTYAKGHTSRVSGQDILKDYFSFDTDSVVNAIYDAWDNLFVGLKMTKTLFFNDYSRDLSFHMYLRMATDMVICERLIDKNGITQNIDSGLGVMLNGISVYCKLLPSKVNFYMAFRASDMALHKNNFQAIYEEIMQLPIINKYFDTGKNIRLSNALYSYFIYSLTLGDTSIDRTIYNKNNIIYNQAQKDVNVSDNDIIEKRQELQVHVNKALGCLNALDIISHAKAYLSSHVYYTATPIDDSANIYKNTSKDQNVAIFSDFMEDLSLCFGSMQLCIDILKQHNRFVYENEDTYGSILDRVLK